MVSGEFLVALVECRGDAVAQLTQAIADGMAPNPDEVEVDEQRLRPGLPELVPFRELNADLAEALSACAVAGQHQQESVVDEDPRRARRVAVGQHQVELLGHERRDEVGSDAVADVEHLGEDPLDLDDSPVLALRQIQELFVAPATHLELHLDQRDAEPRFARIVWQRLAELVERPQPGLQRLLEPVLREPPFIRR